MNIVVLAGGLSAERDVSLVTGSKVSAALRSRGHQVLLLDVFMGWGREGDPLDGIFDHSEAASVPVSGIPAIAPDLASVKAMREDQSDCFFGPNVIRLCRAADVVFMALHGENGENGKLQAAFDLYGIKYTGSDYLSSAISMNKKMSKRFFEADQIPTPRGISVRKSSCTGSFADTGLTLPCVVKPCCGGSSIGVSIVRTEEEYKAALEEAFRWEEEIIIEDYIEGREFAIGVIGYEALPIIEIAPIEGFYDYKNKYQAGSAVETCPADLPEDITIKMQGYAVAVARALGLDTYSRMDFVLDKQNRIFCLEANTLPGMTATSLLPQEAQAAGISYEDLCQKLIDISLKKDR